jgi:hypothetical protein
MSFAFFQTLRIFPPPSAGNAQKTTTESPFQAGIRQNSLLPEIRKVFLPQKTVCCDSGKGTKEKGEE